MIAKNVAAVLLQTCLDNCHVRLPKFASGFYFIFNISRQLRDKGSKLETTLKLQHRQRSKNAHLKENSTTSNVNFWPPSSQKWSKSASPSPLQCWPTAKLHSDRTGNIVRGDAKYWMDSCSRWQCKIWDLSLPF